MKIERTSRGLAETMFDELELLMKGDSTPQQARAKAALANTICSITRLEMDHAKYVSQSRSRGKAELPPLEMVPLVERKKK